MEDNLINETRDLRIPSHTIWTMQRTSSVPTMDHEVLMEHIDMCYIVYLAGVLIDSNTLQQHRKDVSKILEAIRKSGMKVKPSKCEFHQNQTEYLGFIIGQEGVKTDPVKTQAIWDWTTPKTIKEIQCFLGFCNLYRRFIEGFSRPARPLYARTKMECIGNWEWGDKQQQAFDELRTKLTTAPVLVYFDPLAPTKIDKQTPQNTSVPVYYHSNARPENGDQWPTAPRRCQTPNATTAYTIRNYLQ